MPEGHVLLSKFKSFFFCWLLECFTGPSYIELNLSKFLSFSKLEITCQFTHSYYTVADCRSYTIMLINF